MTGGSRGQEFAPDELFGPLNEVEPRNAPRQLFVAGDVSILRTGARVAIVGSRKASAEGIQRTVSLATLLAERKVVVVSGLAQGIDTAAHRTAIRTGGKTIAVIGTPLSEAYPKENTELQRLLTREHLVISEFPEGAPVGRSNFPRRNWTMALIDHASVIVEAEDSSGSLSHGREALRPGRPLFIARSIVENSALRWPGEMLDHGEQVLSDPEEIFARIPTGRDATIADLGI